MASITTNTRQNTRSNVDSFIPCSTTYICPYPRTICSASYPCLECKLDQIKSFLGFLEDQRRNSSREACETTSLRYELDKQESKFTNRHEIRVDGESNIMRNRHSIMINTWRVETAKGVHLNNDEVYESHHVYCE